MKRIILAGIIFLSPALAFAVTVKNEDMASQKINVWENGKKVKEISIEPGKSSANLGQKITIELGDQRVNGNGADIISIRSGILNVASENVDEPVQNSEGENGGEGGQSGIKKENKAPLKE